MNLYTEEIKLKEENRLFYSDTGETKELGCIGHLRGDFGHDGKEFWTTWFPHENHEKNDEVFREIFDRVINLCREKGNPLFGRGDMRAYCREHPECRLETGYSPTWGFRIPTQEYMLYLRCCPDVVGDYNFYVYAYDKQMLMKKLAEERGLPLYCYGYLPTTGEEIRIDFATSGYTPYRKLKSDKDVKEINREIGVTPAQAEAMRYSEPDFASYYSGERKAYADVFAPADTWWGQVIAALGGELLVNDSFSGSTVCRLPEHAIPSYACSDERTSSLGRGGRLPDVIMIFMGINDWGYGVKIFPDEGEAETLSVFSVAYRCMLDKLRKNYPQSELWCLTLPAGCPEQRGECFQGRHFRHRLEEYCGAICTCAEQCGCRVIDLYHAVEAFLTVDGFHPNAQGMKTLAEAMLGQL